MKATTIISGNFAKSAGNKGNFTGYNAVGEQIFISKAMIEKIGIKTDKDFVQFYALVDTKSYNSVDANNNPIGTFERLTALSIYKTSLELNTAKNADKLLDIEGMQQLEEAVTSANLSEDSIRAIFQASSFL